MSEREPAGQGKRMERRRRKRARRLMTAWRGHPGIASNDPWQQAGALATAAAWELEQPRGAASRLDIIALLKRAEQLLAPEKEEEDAIMGALKQCSALMRMNNYGRP